MVQTTEHDTQLAYVQTFFFLHTLHTYTGVQVSMACLRASLLLALSKPTSVAHFVRRRR